MGRGYFALDKDIPALLFEVLRAGTSRAPAFAMLPPSLRYGATRRRDKPGQAASGLVKPNQGYQTTWSELVRVSKSWSSLVRERIKPLRLCGIWNGGQGN
jgi:hypothetical protein